MEKLIECQWEGKDGEPHVGDAVVEYMVLIDQTDEGELQKSREIIAVFLPDYIPTKWRHICRQAVAKDFHASPMD